MKNFSQNYIDGVIGREATTLATCFRFQLNDGRILGFTTLDRDVVFIEEPQLIYKTSSISKTAFSASNSMSVDNIDGDLIIDNDMINVKDLEHGVYDNASIRVFRFNYMITPRSLNDIDKIVEGVVGEVSRSKNQYNCEFRSKTQFLQNKVVEKASPICPYILGDSNCTKDLTNFTFLTTITEVINNTTFKINLTKDNNFFSYGKVTYLTGQSANTSSDINYNVGNEIHIQVPTNYSFAVGDEIRIIAGCDKTVNSCVNKFNNVINFGGLQFIQGYKSSSS